MEITGDEGQTVDAVAATSVLQTERGVFQVSDGMEVVGSDGAHVGQLEEVRPTERDILVHRAIFKRSVYVPFDAIMGVRDAALVLTIPADAVAHQGWPRRPLLDLSSD